MNSPTQKLSPLEASLKSSITRPEPPTAHAESIMRAVRAAGSPAPHAAARASWRWAPMSVFALTLLLALAWVVFRPPQAAAPDLRAAGSVLEAGPALAQYLPESVLAPLSDEWASLDHDLDHTAEFLLASLP
jgi:hypothetical protein